MLAVHADVLADVATDDAGRYRAGRVLITGTRFVPPGPHRFAELLPASLDLAADASVPAILRAAELHYNLVAVHPFADGNGRTARLAMNAVALSHGLPLIVVAVEDRPAYLTALDEANAGNPAPFAALVLRSAAATIRRLIGD